MPARVMQSPVSRMVLHGFMAAIAFAVAIGAVSFWLQVCSGQAAANEEHDQSVLHAVDLVLQSEINAETGQRGYLITSNLAYLAPYRAGVAAVQGNIAWLASLLPDDAANRAAIGELRTQSAIKFAEMARTIALEQTLGFGAAQAVVDNNSGANASNRIRAILGQWSAAYGAKAVLQRQELQNLVQRTNAALLGSGVVVAGLLLWAFSRILQNINSQIIERDALLNANETLTLATASASIGTWDWDIVHDIMSWDDRMYRLYDARPQRFSTAEIWASRLHKDDRAAAEHAVGEAIAGVRSFDTGFRVVWRDGSVRHIRATGIVMRDAAGMARRMLGVNWDITAQIAETLALREATERMQVAADGGKLGIIEYDLATDLVSLDAWVYRIYGTPPGPDFWVSPELWERRVHPEDRERCKLARDNAVAGIRPYDIEYRIIRDDGAIRYIRGAAQVTRDAEGRPLRMTGTVQDITEAKETTAALAATVVELKRSNEELSQFAAIASHDLQEPLRMVASYTRLLAARYKGRLDSDADEFIGFAVDGALRMQRLIQDLLAYSRVGANGVGLRSTASEAALAGALRNLQGAIRESGAAITHDFLPAVLADASQLTQLFQNLVGNAIKYRRAGVPLIHVSASFAAGRWRFEVRDNGLGIETQHFERIFGMFQRLHGVDQYSGTGIGLAICKKIVDRHGGIIGVESVPGEGSCFHFTLAAAPAAEANGLAERRDGVAALV
jgi:signal transduction histidine kinase/CHASE3 domain sensor protein